MMRSDSTEAGRSKDGARCAFELHPAIPDQSLCG